VFDKAAFEADVLAILKGSPVGDLLASGVKFDLRSFSGDIKAIQQLAPAIVASIQIVKDELQAQHPGEAWNHISIETAAKILNDSIVLTGWWGSVKAFLLGPVIRALLEGALGTFKILAKDGNWLALARAALALAGA
jgi:hypothetical protein